MSWTTYTVYNFADGLHWPELGILLESIDYHEAARKASILGSMCEDSLMAAIHFERRFDALMKYVINSQEHPIGKVKYFIYRVEFEIRGSCHYLADVELYQLVKRLQTHSHSKYFQKTPPSFGRFKFQFVL